VLLFVAIATVNKKIDFLLGDQSGPSNVYSAQRWKRNAMNPCLNTTYRFVETLVDSLIELHRPAQALQTFHIGGDEVPEGVWNDSTACQKYLWNENIKYAIYYSISIFQKKRIKSCPRFK
jgi:hexosaminidase